MDFEFTPEEALPAARAALEELRVRGMRVRVEAAAWDDAPRRSTLLGEARGLKLLVEAQGALSYGSSLRQFAAYLGARRHYSELVVCVEEDAELSHAGLLADMREDGVGVWVTSTSRRIREVQRARNPALVVVPDPNLAFGSFKPRVRAAVQKFNDVGQKDGFRDLAELVEELTRLLGVAAAKKKLLKMPPEHFVSKDWSSQINELARKEAYKDDCKPLLDEPLKVDLHSFRGARNLFDHPPRGRDGEKRRGQQATERMMTGTRLAAALVSAKRRIR